jgi:MFS transporter, DHA2 family, methylenomycin A resistance protein
VPTNPDDGGRRRATLVATSLGFAIVQLDVSVVNVAIKPIGASLGGGVSALQWVVSAYTLAFAAFILSAGALGDRVGSKRIFVIGFGVFTVASAACGFAPTIGALIAMRVLQGLGAALLVPCSLTLLNHSYPEASQRARAIGLWAAGASTALAAGPLVGGAVTAALGWRAIFFINAPLGLIGIVLTLRGATETPCSSQEGLDIPGQLTASIGLGALAAATIEGGSHGFGNLLVIGAYVVAGLMAVAFITIEHRRSSPMLPLGLFRSPTFSSATAVGLLINIIFYGLIFVLSLFFQRGQHLSPLRAGLEFAPMTAAVMAANLLARRPTARLGPWPVIAIGAGLMGLGLVALLNADTSSSYAALVIQLLAIGFGLGLIVPTMTSALLGSVEPARSGVASGTLNSARQVGSVIGVAVYGSLLAHGRLSSGFHLALWVSAGLALAVIAIAWASNGA